MGELRLGHSQRLTFMHQLEQVKSQSVISALAADWIITTAPIVCT